VRAGGFHRLAGALFLGGDCFLDGFGQLCLLLRKGFVADGIFYGEIFARKLSRDIA
jgi:hypothetical protein